MFEKERDVKAIFDQFRLVEEKEDLMSSKALQNHAMLVMYTLDDVISSLDDQEFVVDLLLKTGRSHRRFENFKTSVFWVIFGV